MTGTPPQHDDVRPIHIKILVPTTKIDKKISQTQITNRVKQTVNFLNTNFGGSTRISGTGSFRFKGKDIEEKVIIVESFAKPKEYAPVRAQITNWLRRKRREWKQISLAFEFEENLYFIEG